MSRRLQRSRCYVCSTTLSHFGFSINMFSWTQGWHQVMPLCQPCAKAIFAITAEVRREYQ